MTYSYVTYSFIPKKNSALILDQLNVPAKWIAFQAL